MIIKKKNFIKKRNKKILKKKIACLYCRFMKKKCEYINNKQCNRCSKKHITCIKKRKKQIKLEDEMLILMRNYSKIKKENIRFKENLKRLKEKVKKSGNKKLIIK